MSDNGQSALSAYIGAFERVNGRSPTTAENREALALVEVVRAAKLDPFLVFYLANKRAQDALERIPVETQSVIDEGIIKIREVVERATRCDCHPLRARSGSRPLATTEAATSPELPRFRRESRRRSEVTLVGGSYRGIIIAYVLAATTVAFTSWAVSGYSIRIVPALIVVAAFVSGVAGTSVLYELQRQ